MPRREVRLVQNGESLEDIRPDLIIPTGKRKGRNPSLASIYRALARTQKLIRPFESPVLCAYVG